MEQNFQNVPLNEIRVNENTRKTFDEKSLGELAQSIKKNGVLEPILLNKVDGGGYFLIAGERRFRASGLAGLVTIPAVVREETDPQVILQWQITENLQREALNYMEEARAILKLREDGALVVSEIVKILGKSEAYVHMQLQLCRMPESVQRACELGHISKGVAWAIARLPAEHQETACTALARTNESKMISLNTAQKYLKETFGENRVSKRIRNHTQKATGNDYLANWKKYLIEFTPEQFDRFKRILQGRIGTQEWAEAVDIIMIDAKR